MSEITTQRRISVKQYHEQAAGPSNSEALARVDAELAQSTSSDGRLRLPPIEKSGTPVKTEIIRRDENFTGPPLNRASVLKYHAIRQQMSRLSADNPYGQPYGGRQSKMRGRRSTGTPSANDSSILSSHPNSTRSSRLSNHSRLSNYSVIHPLSENNDSLFYKGRTKWSDEPIKSKVGSLDNYYHRPGGGDKDIREIKYHLNAPNSISSMTKVIYGPRRNDVGLLRSHDHDAGDYQRLPNRIRRPRNVKSRIGSLDNVHHQPGGGTREIFTERMPWQEGYKHRKG